MEVVLSPATFHHRNGDEVLQGQGRAWGRGGGPGAGRVKAAPGPGAGAAGYLLGRARSSVGGKSSSL